MCKVSGIQVEYTYAYGSLSCKCISRLRGLPVYANSTTCMTYLLNKSIYYLRTLDIKSYFLDLYSFLGILISILFN